MSDNDFSRNELRYTIRSFSRKSVVIAVIVSLFLLGVAHDLVVKYRQHKIVGVILH